MKQNQLPPGWDLGRIERILTHYEPRMDKPVFNPLSKILIEVPDELVPAIQEMIASHQAVIE